MPSDSTLAGPDVKPHVIVLGAGIAGLFAASHLIEQGFAVTVVERGPVCGGAHQSRTIGPYTFDYGSIFYEHHARLFELADGLREKCPAVDRRQRRIGSSGQLMHYPIEPRELLGSSLSRTALGVADLIRSRFTIKSDGTLDTICRQRLGSRFFEETGLAAYIGRFNRVSPTEIDEAFFFHRMSFIEKATRTGALFDAAIRSVRRTKKRPGQAPKPLRIRPIEGFAALFDPIRERLERQGVVFRFNEEVMAIDSASRPIAITTTKGVLTADSVVSTIPIETLHRTLFGTDTGLVSLDMTTLFVSAAQLNKAAGNVLFNFHADGQWKRATIYSRLYPDNLTDREFLAVEVTLPSGAVHEPELAFEDFSQHLTRLGIARDLRLEGSAFLDNCYPLYSPRSNEILGKTLDKIAATGIVTVGRQGRFEYLPTSTGVIRRVGEELARAGLVPVAA